MSESCVGTCASHCGHSEEILDLDGTQDSITPTPSEKEWFKLFSGIEAQLKRIADVLERDSNGTWSKVGPGKP
jgi:hypothetical protein